MTTLKKDERGKEMNKSELIEKIARDANINKTEAKKGLKSLFEGFTQALQEDGKVTIKGFGTLVKKTQKSRECFNPFTSKIFIRPEMNVAKFRPSSKLKNFVS